MEKSESTWSSILSYGIFNRMSSSSLSSWPKWYLSFKNLKSDSLFSLIWGYIWAAGTFGPLSYRGWSRAGAFWAGEFLARVLAPVCSDLSYSPPSELYSIWRSRAFSTSLYNYCFERFLIVRSCALLMLFMLELLSINIIARSCWEIFGLLLDLPLLMDILCPNFNFFPSLFLEERLTLIFSILS